MARNANDAAGSEYLALPYAQPLNAWIAIPANHFAKPKSDKWLRDAKAIKTKTLVECACGELSETLQLSAASYLDTPVDAPCHLTFKRGEEIVLLRRSAGAFYFTAEIRGRIGSAFTTLPNQNTHSDQS